MNKIIILFCFIFVHLNGADKKNFASVADTEHFSWLVNLIGTIHRYHACDELGKIAIFDLGLTETEKESLSTLAGIEIHQLEKVNPDMFTKFSIRDSGKVSRGWYCWKAVVIKQTLDLFNKALYLDSGISVQGNLTPIFEQIDQKGYFLVDCGHSIRRMTIKPVIDRFNLQSKDLSWVLDTMGISSGIQGISRCILLTYVKPIYDLSSNLKYFIDDGTAPKGYGWSRHDQSLFSIQARLLHMSIHEMLRGGRISLSGKKYRFTDFFKITRSEFDDKESQKFLRKRNV